MNADWKVDKAQYAEFNVPTCGKIAVWQCRGKTGFLEQSWWLEFDMFGSMPWCSLADANELLYSLQSKFDRSVYIRVFAEGDLDRTTEAIVPDNNEWKVEKAECQHAPMCAIRCQHGPTLQFVSCAGKESLSGTVMMAWIWCVWINAIVFVPMAQAPLEADANELLKSTV